MIVGLGNPGKKYAHTRHNAGFMAVDLIRRKIGSGKERKTCSSVVSSGKVGGEEVILAKPQTYMNVSGEAVSALLDQYPMTVDDMTVIHDDIDIEAGKFKEKNGGGSAGHNGIASIMDELGTGDFRRLRVGVGRPPEGVDPADYVLLPFEENEKEMIERTLDEVCERAIVFRKHD